VSCLSQAVWPAQLPVVQDACGNVLSYSLPVNVTTGSYQGSNFCNGGFRRYTFKFKDPCNPDIVFNWTFRYEILPSAPPSLADDQADCSSLDQTGINKNLAEAISFDPKTLEADVATLYEDVCGSAISANWLETIPDAANNDASWVFTYRFQIENTCSKFVFCEVVYSGGEVPVTIVLDDRTVNDGETLCFGASETITVSDLTVHDGGSVTFIAGESVQLLPGVLVQHGGHLHAYISNSYCVNPTPLVAVKDTEVLPQDSDQATKNETFFKVYPNPTLGLFTLELDEPGHAVIVEIYTMLGEQIVRKNISGLRKYEFDLSTQSNAVYIIRILNGETIGFERVIKQ
jgi:hypothetical protein